MRPWFPPRELADWMDDQEAAGRASGDRLVHLVADDDVDDDAPSWSLIAACAFIAIVAVPTFLFWIDRF